MMKILSTCCFIALNFLKADTLTLETCIEKSLRHHPDIQKASLDILYSKQITEEAKSLYLPQINLTAQYAPINTFVLPQNSTFHTVDESFWQASATLHQKVYDFGATSSLVDAHRETTQEAEYNLNDLKALMVYKIKTLYNLALLHQRTLEARQMDVQTKEALYQQSLALVKEGLKTEVDSASFESARYLSLEQLKDTEIALQKAITTLFFYMGEELQETESVTLTELVDNLPPKENQTQYTSSDNFSLRAMESQIQSSTLQYHASESSHYGSIDAYANYSYQESLNEYDTTQIGISYTLPLYTGGAMSAKTEQLLMRKESLQASYKAKELALKEQIQNTLLDLQKYRAIVQSKQATIKASMGAKNIIEARYKEGLATYIEVLDANTQHLNAKIGLEVNKFSIAEALYRLDYIQGKSE